VEIELATFVNRHFETPAVIVGSSPNLEHFCFDTFEGVVIGVGDSPLRCLNLFQTDYWVVANSYWPRPWCSRDASALNDVEPQAAFIASTMFAYQNPEDFSTMQRLIRENVRVPLVIFRTTHGNFEELDVSLLDTSDKRCNKVSSLSIQELVAKLAGSEGKYSSGSSSAVHALALALIMGCSPINIIGVDLPHWLHDYRYYCPLGWRKTIKKYGSMGPFCEDFTRPEFKARFRVSGPLRHEAEMLRSRVFSFLGKPIASDFGAHRVSLMNDFQYLARVAADRVGKTDVFVNSSRSALSEMMGFQFKSCHCGTVHK